MPRHIFDTPQSHIWMTFSIWYLQTNTSIHPILLKSDYNSLCGCCEVLRSRLMDRHKIWSTNVSGHGDAYAIEEKKFKLVFLFRKKKN